MPTVLDTLQKGTGYLEKFGVEDARLNMQYLLAHILKCNRLQIYVDFDRELTEPQLVALRGLTKRRGNGEPLQHLLGTSIFCGLEFKTDARALIPRPETEELTELCAKLELPENPAILDMGCGSGVIGLTLAHRLAGKHPKIVLADLSAEALSLALVNQETVVPTARITLVQSDLFSNITGTFDLVVANLPYISKSEETTLSREVRRDPAMALYGGNEGTELIERFLVEVNQYLNPGATIALEFGIDQGEKVKHLTEKLEFQKIQVIKDLCGRNRFLFAVKSRNFS